MAWLLKIEDPSGETRRIALEGARHGALTLGRAEDADVCLRDPTVAPRAAVLWPAPSDEGSPYWVRVQEGTPAARLADVPVREANLPPGLPIVVGETRLTLEAGGEERPLPVFPAGVRPWLTASEEGRRTLWTARKAAATPLSIYLAGETGTGKEVLAHLVHAWSERAAGPFVPLHCGALPLALAESELFGHVKGAFTGAVSHRPGALMQAHGGTLFLDEVGDLALDVQVKLLRFLENGEIRPVGADRPSRADVRVLCATHHGLRRLVEEGRFRRDLYYRLASVTVEIPPLRGRPDDIELLSTRFATELGRALTPRALLRLQAHEWPGNVRELRHAIERASGLAGPFSPLLDEDAFAFLLTPDAVAARPELELGAAVLSLEEMERVLILKALRLSKGNRREAAKILGIARSTLFEMLKRHRIVGPKAPAA
jgi:two-component system response regulator HydG